MLHTALQHHHRQHCVGHAARPGVAASVRPASVVASTTSLRPAAAVPVAAAPVAGPSSRSVVVARVAQGGEAGASPSTSSPQQQGAWSQAELDTLWSGVSRALIKLGKGGPQGSHARSLAELLPAHTLVKVKQNGDPSHVAEAGKQLAALCGGATLLDVRGPYMLFADASCSPAQLLEAAGQAGNKIQGFHKKRAEAAKLQEAEEKAAEGRAGAAKEKGGSKSSSSAGGGGSINQLIDSVVTSTGRLTRSALRSEWDSLEQKLYEAEVAEAEAAARNARAPNSKALRAPPSGRAKVSKAPWRANKAAQ